MLKVNELEFCISRLLITFFIINKYRALCYTINSTFRNLPQQSSF